MKTPRDAVLDTLLEIFEESKWTTDAECAEAVLNALLDVKVVWALRALVCPLVGGVKDTKSPPPPGEMEWRPSPPPLGKKFKMFATINHTYFTVKNTEGIPEVFRLRTKITKLRYRCGCGKDHEIGTGCGYYMEPVNDDEWEKMIPPPKSE